MAKPRKLKGMGLINMPRNRYIPVSRLKNNAPKNKTFRKTFKGNSIKKVGNKSFILRNRKRKSKIRL